MTASRIYIVGSSDPVFPIRLVKASIRQQALSHVAQSLFTVRVASQDDLVNALGKGVRGGQMRKLTEETQFICMKSSVEFS